MSKPKVVFENSNHSYWMGDTQLTSVSSNLSTYENPYDKEYWLDHVTFKKLIPDYVNIKRKISKSIKPDLSMFRDMVDQYEFDLTRSVIDTQWGCERDRASIMGTMLHSYMENLSLIRGGCDNPYSGVFFPIPPEYSQMKVLEYDNNSLLDNLYDLPDGFYPELLIFNDTYAGQADLVFIETVDSVRYVSIGDYKSNKKKPYQSSGIDMMLEPLGHLRQNKYNRYKLQISAYAYMLESVGFTVKDLGFTWIKNYDMNYSEVITFDYMKDEISLIF